MKKTTLFLALIFSVILISCSSDSDNNSSSSIQINPPAWIQGTWLLEISPGVDAGWRFTSNDFIIIQAGFEISQRGQLETFLESGEDVSANDESTDNTYTVTSNFLAGQTTIYSFTRISDTEISWDRVPNSIYTKQ